MFEKAEGVADAARAEEDGVEEILVRGVAVTEAFPRVKEEWDGEVFFGAAFAEPEEFGDEIC